MTIWKKMAAALAAAVVWSTGAWAQDCAPYSDAACTTVPVAASPAFTLNFNAPAGGLSDTGFTMVDTHSTNRYPLTPSLASYPGWEPANIAVTGGQLVITTTRGASQQTQAQNTANNTQVNALGVGLSASSAFNLAVDVVNPPMPDTSNGEYAGLWFGLNEDNFVRLVVVNRTGAGNASIELRREIGGVTDGTAANTRLANITNATTATIRLQLQFNPAANQVLGRYTSSTGETGLLGPLVLPAAFFAGQMLPDGATGPVSFGGVFASSRFNTVTPAIPFAFDNFAVEPPGAAPVAVADAIAVAQGSTATVLTSGATSVLANDTDPEGDALTAVLVQGPANGTLTLNANGTFSYTHNNSFTTSDSFVYRANDGLLNSNTVTVAITVSTACLPYSPSACGTVPVAMPFSLNFNAAAGGLANTGFTAVDTHSVNRYPATPSVTNMPGYEPSLINLTGGQLVITATRGSWQQTQAENTSNNTQVNALAVGVNSTTTFIAAVDVVNPPLPDTSNGEFAGLWFGLNEDNLVRLVAMNRTGAGNALVELRREIAGVSSAGATDTRQANLTNATTATIRLELELNPATNQVTGRFTSSTGETGALGPLTVPAAFFTGQTLPDGATGPVSFAGIATSNRFNAGAPLPFAFDNFSLSPPGTAPVAAADSMTVVRGGVTSTLNGGATSVLANDTDAENDPLTAAVVAGPANGSLTLNPNGTFSYTHNGNASTTDTFVYRASDGVFLSNTVTVAITIVGPPDVTAPTITSVAVPANATYMRNQTLSFTVNFSENVLVAGSPRLAVTLDTGGPAFATYVSGSGTSALQFRYVVAAGQEDLTGIALAAALDLNGGTLRDAAGNNALLPLNGVGATTAVLVRSNTAPVAVADAFILIRGGTATTLAGSATSVLANDTDAESDPLTAVLVTGPANGSLTLNANGTFSYTHNGGPSAADSFEYRVSDGSLLSNIVTVGITVTAPAAAPRAVPVAGPWGLAVLAAVIALAGMGLSRRRKGR